MQTASPTSPVTRKAAPAAGLRCPVCSSALDSVSFTRPAVNRIYRARKCKSCGHRVKTAESIVAG